MKMTIFFFFKIPSSSVFVSALKFLQKSQKSAKSCVVLFLKKQVFVLENHGICKERLKYQNMIYKRAYFKSELTIRKKLMMC